MADKDYIDLARHEIEWDNKMKLGRYCEDLVKEIVEKKSGWVVENINDSCQNHPVTDLIVRNPETGKEYEISVKSTQTNVWPRVRGITKSNEYLVFVSVTPEADPEFFVLNNRQWLAFLKKILPTRDPGGKIVEGTIVWVWGTKENKKSFRGTQIKKEELKKYRNKWSTLPGVGCDNPRLTRKGGQ
ncbi:hypothetical protein [Desulfosoma sp.]